MSAHFLDFRTPLPLTFCPFSTIWYPCYVQGYAFSLLLDFVVSFTLQSQLISGSTQENFVALALTNSNDIAFQWQKPVHVIGPKRQSMRIRFSLFPSFLGASKQGRLTGLFSHCYVVQRSSSDRAAPHAGRTHSDTRLLVSFGHKSRYFQAQLWDIWQQCPPLMDIFSVGQCYSAQNCCHFLSRPLLGDLLKISRSYHAFLITLLGFRAGRIR